MQFSCQVCKALKPVPRGLRARDLSDRCHSCVLLRAGITAVLGAECWDIVTRIEILRAVGEIGPLRVDVVHEGKFPTVNLQFYYLADSAAPWSSIGVGSNVGYSGASNATLTQVHRWLHACLAREDSHQLCAPYREDQARLPTRVLDVGIAYSQSPIRLHTTKPGDTGRYIALSHCWGGSVATVTTEDSLEEYSDGIPVPLPQTFQDAVWVTRALGVRYLWIDSFCILQDSLEDWHAQAPQMAAVYGNAYLTLSADAAANSNEGFLQGSQRDLNRPHRIRYDALKMKGYVYVRERCSRAQHSPVHDWVSCDKDSRLPAASKLDIRLFSKITHRMDPQARSPLSKRAWVLQERVLSPRTLHFGHAEAGWECRSQANCECSPLDSLDNSIDRPTLKDAMSKTPWTGVVRLFSNLELTSQEDRLVAISGLAKVRYDSTHDRYVAGLWLPTIKDDLLWSTGSYPSSGQWSRRRLNSAPSWSWASTTGRIVFPYSEYPITPSSISEADRQAMLHSFSVKSVTKLVDPFGATIKADLCIEGLLAGVYLTHDEEKPIAHIHSRTAASRTSPVSTRCSIAWDDDHEARTGRYVLLPASFHTPYSMVGLLLKEQSRSLHFQRIGFMTLLESEHFRACHDLLTRNTFKIS